MTTDSQVRVVIGCGALGQHSWDFDSYQNGMGIRSAWTSSGTPLELNLLPSHLCYGCPGHNPSTQWDDHRVSTSHWHGTCTHSTIPFGFIRYPRKRHPWPIVGKVHRRMARVGCHKRPSLGGGSCPTPETW